MYLDGRVSAESLAKPKLRKTIQAGANTWTIYTTTVASGVRKKIGSSAWCSKEGFGIRVIRFRSASSLGKRSHAWVHAYIISSVVNVCELCSKQRPHTN